MSKPNSSDGRRAVALLRVQAAMTGAPEPSRAERRAAARKAPKAAKRS